MDVTKCVRLLNKSRFLEQLAGGAVFPLLSGFQPASRQTKKPWVLALAKQDFVFTGIGQEDPYPYAGNFDSGFRVGPFLFL